MLPNDISSIEEMLRRMLGIDFGKVGLSNLSNFPNLKFPIGSLIRKTDIAITIRSGEVTKKYERTLTQYGNI